MKANHLLRLVAAVAAIVALTGCHDAPDYKDSAEGNFDALWSIIDSRYCFFEEKDIDWEAIGEKYRSRIDADTRGLTLFNLFGEMLDELQDGHVNLISSFNTSYYRKWWTDYPQNFNLRTLEEYYLDFDWMTTSGIIYKRLTPEIGYIYYPSFSSGISETALDYVFLYLSDCETLIFDVRDNGGGMLTNVERLAGRFITREITGGYIRHKTGPGHNDFSEPYRFTYKPADEARPKWLKPIIILTNRSTFSAANDFIACMKGMDGVTVVGARTGGGGGLPFSSELPNGWSVRFSASPISDRNGNPTEFGIEPDHEVDAPDEELAQGKDAILDYAIALAGQSNQQ